MICPQIWLVFTVGEFDDLPQAGAICADCQPLTLVWQINVFTILDVYSISVFVSSDLVEKMALMTKFCVAKNTTERQKVNMAIKAFLKFTQPKY